MEDIKVGVTVILDKFDSDTLDRLCEGLNKSRSEVVAAALYLLEQSLMYDPTLEKSIAENYEVDCEGM
jgi:Arc/MetJ-type ribon-helix-helix transcriptional regulator